MKALLSVSNKEGIVEFAQELENLDYEILSTGGTATLLREHNIEVTDVSTYTGFPELMDGRVKTLHPKIYGGLLAIRDNPGHVEQAKDNDIEMIDIVAVNLYPFQEIISRDNVSREEAIENIDIGGPTMLRGAAKNHKYVTVIVNPADYKQVLGELKSGQISLETRQKLALKVFKHTTDYDSAIDKYLSKEIGNEDILRLNYSNGQPLRYGENWHQSAMFYKTQLTESCIANAEILNGKDMSYNNYVDCDAALEIVKEFKEPAVSVIKHTNPCGFAIADSIPTALELAWKGDTISAFGSVIACNKVVNLSSAEFLKGKFIEALIAPGFSEEALDFLKNKSKDLRILKIPEIGELKPLNQYKSITGGILEQSRDIENYKEWNCITKKEFEKEDLAEFIWKVCKHIKSNAIGIGYEYEPNKFMLLGMGAGQPNRLESVRLAVNKALENLEALNLPKGTLNNCVMASDAFFPFDDAVREAAKHGIKFIIQPGGSKRDDDVIAACNELDVSMIITEMRHFKH